MRKVNTKEVAEDAWSSPKGKFAGFYRGISEALGREPPSTDLGERHPFDMEICRIPAGKINYPYHTHSAQWEFYLVISGRGQVRHQDGMTPVEEGDSFLFRPDEAHQIINDGKEDLVVCVIADNPIGGFCYYPDSKKWLVSLPERRLIRSEGLDYLDGEE